jgi:hypothetical protein
VLGAVFPIKGFLILMHDSNNDDFMIEILVYDTKGKSIGQTTSCFGSHGLPSVWEIDNSMNR